MDMTLEEIRYEAMEEQRERSKAKTATEQQTEEERKELFLAMTKERHESERLQDETERGVARGKAEAHRLARKEQKENARRSADELERVRLEAKAERLQRQAEDAAQKQEGLVKCTLCGALNERGQKVCAACGMNLRYKSVIKLS